MKCFPDWDYTHSSLGVSQDVRAGRLLVTCLPTRGSHTDATTAAAAAAAAAIFTRKFTLYLRQSMCARNMVNYSLCCTCNTISTQIIEAHYDHFYSIADKDNYALFSLVTSAKAWFSCGLVGNGSSDPKHWQKPCWVKLHPSTPLCINSTQVQMDTSQWQVLLQGNIK